MNTKNLLAVLCSLLFVALAMPASADNPPDLTSTCATDGNDDDGDDCSFAVVPGSLRIKGVVSAGVGLCQTDNNTLPLFCDADPGTGAIPGTGAVFFVDNDTFPWPGGNKALRVWIEMDPTFCLTGVVCGIDALLCNDRDLSGICTNTGFAGDQLVSGQSNMEVLTTQVDGVNCDANEKECVVGVASCDEGQKKDTKDCGDNFDLELSMCGKPNFALDAPGPWAPSQVVVFVGFWVDVVLGGNVGAGLTPGNAEVWLKWVDSTCEPEGADQPGGFTGCLWELDEGFPPGPRTDSGPDTCESSPGEPAVCLQAMVVFAAAVAGTVTAQSTGCYVSGLQTATFPVVAVDANAGLTNGGPTFVCTVNWAPGSQGVAGCVGVGN